jgi:Tol biopolymer transport system component
MPFVWSSAVIGMTATEQGPAGHIYTVSPEGGTPQRLHTPMASSQWPFWSKDRQWIYFAAEDKQHQFQVWKMRPDGKDASQLTRNGGDQPQESADGRTVFFARGFPQSCTIWSIPAAGGDEVKVLENVAVGDQWRATKEGIYYITPGENSHPEIRLYDFRTLKSRTLHTMSRPAGFGISLSPNGGNILFAQVDETGGDLMLVENFR